MRLVTGFILILLAFALGGFTRGNNAHVFMDRLSVMSIVRHHQKLSMIASVTNQGKTRWMIIDEAFDAEKPIEFLQAMIKGTGKKVILILDHLRVHHSRLVKAWVAERKSD